MGFFSHVGRGYGIVPCHPLLCTCVLSVFTSLPSQPVDVLEIPAWDCLWAKAALGWAALEGGCPCEQEHWRMTQTDAEWSGLKRFICRAVSCWSSLWGTEPFIWAWGPAMSSQVSFARCLKFAMGGQGTPRRYFFFFSPISLLKSSWR